MATNKSTPNGYNTLHAYLIQPRCADALEFYKKAFGAAELMRFPTPDGRIAHAEMKIGEGLFMLADQAPEQGYRSPDALGGTPVSLMFYVRDVDAVFALAVSAGAKVQRAVKDQFYGDRSGTLTDPFGHVWTIATHVENVSSEEMERRMAAMAKD